MTFNSGPEQAAGPASGPPGRRVLPALLTGVSWVFLASVFVSIAVNSLALGLMAVCWLLLMIAQRRWSVVATPLDYAFLGYVAAEAVATVCSVRWEESLFVSRRVLLIGIVYFFASRLESLPALRRTVGVLLGSSAAVALMGILKLLTGGPGENTRLGIFQFYMTTAELMMIALLLAVPFALHPGTPKSFRIAALTAAGLMAITLYATVTRGAYLAAAAGLVCIAAVRDKRLLVPILILCVVLVLFAPPYVEQRLLSIVDIHHPENASRLMLWSAGLRIFADHPVVGVGDIDLGDLLRRYADPGYGGEWGHLHNVALQILVTLGTLGGVAATAMFGMIAVTEWRVYRAVRDDWFAGSVALGSLAAFVGFQVNGLTEWSFGDQEVATLFWVTVGLSLAVGRLKEKAGAGGER
ncbi:MAG: O-antigen ligase family protein [Bacteroidota bacterium]